MASPVFYEDKVVAYVANIAHHNDVGGQVPGSNAADSDSIYAEGHPDSPVKIFQKGELVEDILNLILLNCRVNHIRRGDLNAQFACNRKGVQRVEDVCTRSRHRYCHRLHGGAAGLLRAEDPHGSGGDSQRRAHLLRLSGLRRRG